MTGAVPRGVLLAHAGRQHSWATAEALQQAGLLQAFLTAVDYDPERFFYRAMSRLPQPFDAHLVSKLKRLHVSLGDRSVIKTPGLWPLVFMAGRLIQRQHASFFTKVNDTAFDRWSCDQLAFVAPGAVHLFEGSALRTFTKARRLAIPCILDVPSDHTGIIRIQREELQALQTRDKAHAGRIAKARSEVYSARQLANYLLVPSNHIREALIADGVAPQKIVVIPYGVDVERFVPGNKTSEDRPFTVLFVGALRVIKGLGYLLAAWRKAQLPHARLVIVGGSPDDYVASLQDERDANIIWAGNVPHSEILSYYQSADLFAFPSLCEGSALVTYEAMASALPVITTPTAGSVVRDKEDGFIVPPRDVHALTEALITLHQDRARARRMGQNARLHISSSYTWGHYEKRLADFYTHTVGLTASCPSPYEDAIVSKTAPIMDHSAGRT